MRCACPIIVPLKKVGPTCRLARPAKEAQMSWICLKGGEGGCFTPAVKSAGEALLARVLERVGGDGDNAHARARPALAHLRHHLHSALRMARGRHFRQQHLARSQHRKHLPLTCWMPPERIQAAYQELMCRHASAKLLIRMHGIWLEACARRHWRACCKQSRGRPPCAACAGP